MILVTGMKRSGTSMWMQVLEAAGYKWIGQHYLGAWEKSIQAANPRGFYESRLRQGIFFATNPDPATGAFLPPDATRRHVVKVFIPGLIRTDLAYLDRALATLRPWREQVVSLRRLYAMEDAFFATLPDDQREYGVAAAMLRELGVSTVRLMSNNPLKITGLEGHGITVAGRVPLHVATNEHNEPYIQAKRLRMGHLE